MMEITKYAFGIFVVTVGVFVGFALLMQLVFWGGAFVSLSFNNALTWYCEQTGRVHVYPDEEHAWHRCITPNTPDV